MRLRLILLGATALLISGCAGQRGGVAPELPPPTPLERVPKLSEDLTGQEDPLTPAEKMPFALEVLDEKNDGESLEVYGNVVSNTHWNPDNVWLRLSSLKKGTLVGVTNSPLSKLRPLGAQSGEGELTEPEEKLSFAMSVPAKEMTDYQLQLLWGDEARELNAAAKGKSVEPLTTAAPGSAEPQIAQAAQSAAEPAASPAPLQVAANLSKEQAPLSEKVEAPAPIEVAAASPAPEPAQTPQPTPQAKIEEREPPKLLAELRNLKVEKIKQECSEPPCPVMFKLAAELVNTSSEVLNRVSFGVGYIWAPAGKQLDLSSRIPDNEEKVVLSGLGLKPGVSKQLKLLLDRAVPDRSEKGEFKPVLRITSSEG